MIKIEPKLIQVKLIYLGMKLNTDLKKLCPRVGLYQLEQIIWNHASFKPLKKMIIFGLAGQPINPTIF